MASVRDIQTALKNKGFDPGEVDGIWGRNSIKAVRGFQGANGLTADGVVGPNTMGKLFGGDAPAIGAPAANVAPVVWYGEAERLLGLKEVRGAGDNRTIIDWADQLGIDYDHDDIPWCGLFVAHCVGATLSDEPLPANPLGARNWSKFGQAAERGAPGAILVFWRESPNSGKGHVGFYHAEDATAYHVLGGNQSDSVSVTRVAKSRLVGMRRPTTAGPLPGGPVLVNAQGVLSTNEA